jgi:hypothetical protein
MRVYERSCGPARSASSPGSGDTRCRAAVRGQPIGRGGRRLSRWHLRPPACPRRCTTAEWAPGGMSDRLPPGRSLHRPAGIRLRAWQPGAFPGGPGPLSPAATGRRPGSIRTAPQRAAPMAAATAKNHTMSHLLRHVRAAANAVDMRRYCTGLWSLPASVQGGSDSRITRSARTLVQNWTLSSWPEDRLLARPFGPAGRLEPRAGRASHYPDGGTRQRQLPIRGYGHILNLDSPRDC